MSRPQTPFEQVSYDLNKFRERRMAERRAVPRGTVDRRAAATPERDSGQIRDGREEGLQDDTSH